MTQLYQITTSYFCCGIVVSSENPSGEAEVIDAAPIMSWSVGKKWTEVKSWINKKKGSITRVCQL